MLVAMPDMGDQRFRRSVIYMCAHSDEGAMGIIVNRLADNIRFPELLAQLDIVDEDDGIRLPPAVAHMPVHVGGPVETGRGFVLHSSDYFADSSTMSVDGAICLTATLDILKAIAGGSGPSSVLMALGYAGWAPGQLENEIQANEWLHCEADKGLVFGADLDNRYDQAMQKIGIDPGQLNIDAGHA